MNHYSAGDLQVACRSSNTGGHVHMHEENGRFEFDVLAEPVERHSIAAGLKTERQTPSLVRVSTRLNAGGKQALQRGCLLGHKNVL